MLIDYVWISIIDYIYFLIILVWKLKVGVDEVNFGFGLGLGWRIDDISGFGWKG